MIGKILVLSLFIFVTIDVATLQAAPATYMLSSMFTGTLGSNSFSGAAMTITATADTDLISLVGTGVYHVPTIRAKVELPGVGTATFTDPTMIFENNSQALVGLFTTANFGIFSDYGAPGLDSYHL